MTTAVREEQESAILWRLFEEAKHEHGRQHHRTRTLWAEWFRQRCREGNPPDALRIHSADPVEAFWASVAESADGHWFWMGRTSNGKPVTRSLFSTSTVLAQRFSWMLLRNNRRKVPITVDIWPTCGEPHCINPVHLESGRSSARLRYRNDQLAGGLQACALSLGHSPGPIAYDRWREERRAQVPVASVVRDRFGSWDKACLAAGLEPPPDPREGTRWNQVPNEEGLEALRAVATEIGRAPSRKDWDSRKSQPSRSWFVRRYGTWNDALEAAGLKPRPGHGHERYTPDQILDQARAFAAELGRAPRRDEFVAKTGISESPCRRHWGGYGGMLRAAGLRP